MLWDHLLRPAIPKLVNLLTNSEGVYVYSKAVQEAEERIRTAGRAVGEQNSEQPADTAAVHVVSV